MEIYLFYIRRILKRPMALAIAVLFPVALAYGVVAQYDAATSLSVNVAVADDDIREFLVASLDASGVDHQEVALDEVSGLTGVTVVAGQSLEEVHGDPEGFDAEVSSRTPSATNALLTARLGTTLATVQHLATNSAKPADLRASLETFTDTTAPVTADTHLTGNANAVVLVSSFNMVVFVMLLLTMTNILLFLKDKGYTTTQRILVGTGSKLRYYVQVVLVFASLGVVELGVIIASIRWLFGVPLGIGPEQLAVLVVAYALLNVFVIALGLLIVSRTTKESIGRIAVTTVVLPMSMLGGALWPFSIMPEWMQTVAQVLPTTWVTQLNRELFSGFTPDPWDIARPLGLLLVASVVLFTFLARVRSDRV